MQATTTTCLDEGTQYTLDLLERFQLKDEELFRCFDHAVSKVGASLRTLG